MRCALGMQRECCDPFLHSVSVFTFFMCHFAKLGMPVYEDAEDDGRCGGGGGTVEHLSDPGM